MGYAKWLSAQTGKRYRLPSEEEWEYAARSGGKKDTWTGTSREQELCEYAWYEANSGRAWYKASGGKTQPVGGRKPNALEVYDMSGNVSEWVEDCWHKNYKGALTDGSAWLEAPSLKVPTAPRDIQSLSGSGGDVVQRVLRGGCYNHSPEFLNASYWCPYKALYRASGIGFRLAQDID